jgi:hypothetical protein
VWLERVEKDEEEAGARFKKDGPREERESLAEPRDRGREDEEKRREREREEEISGAGGDRPAGLMRLTGGG